MPVVGAVHTTLQGTHTPCGPVCLGPVDALDPNYEKEGSGQSAVSRDNTGVSISGPRGSDSSDQLPEEAGVLSRPGGRPRIDQYDRMIMELAAEGKGSRMIAKSLRSMTGTVVSYRTVARRLAEQRSED